MVTDSAIAPAPPPGLSARTKTVFEEFLIAEYNNIAQAHFNTVNSISEFFKHYIVIVSLPISAAVIFLKPAELKASGILEFLKKHPLVHAMLFTCLVLIGLSVLAYIINLRSDAILYARTVNGIRKYFSDSSGLNLEDEIRFRVLPKWTHFPRYTEPYYFLFVVLTFAIVGTVYFVAGWYFYWWVNSWPIGLNFWLLIGLCPWTHLFLYAWLGRHREREYLRGHIIGVDIDGVLNDHRQHFVQVLERRTGKKMDARLITRIPVHEIPGGDVTEEDEHAVFNWPSYWVDMPPLTGAAEIVKRLRNLHGYKIWIFTHRGWPQPITYPPGHENECWKAWQKVSWWAIPSRWNFVGAAEKRLGEWGIPGFIGGRPILKITKGWLRGHGFKYNRLIVERGNTNTTDPLILTRNRFLTSQERKIRVFVEDDPIKARKLADICEVVFLIDHPYNQAGSARLPMNVVRVQSWQEIHEFLKRVF